MRAQREAPDFSSIRSPMERAEAERAHEMGLALGDGLYAVGDALSRAIDGVAHSLARKPISDC